MGIPAAFGLDYCELYSNVVSWVVCCGKRFEEGSKEALRRLRLGGQKVISRREKDLQWQIDGN